jgi:acyl phosphate:glycerol-3-phosphate acyltransferase
VQGPLAGVALVTASFLIGAIPWGYFAGKKSRGIDLRRVGSGGTGATNVLRTLGRRASAFVALLDILKGVVPVVFAQSAGIDARWVGAVAVAAVVGHCWSPFIGFKGGKGVATGAGAAIALFPQVLLIVPVMVIVVWTTKYVSLGSLTAAGMGALLAVIHAAAGRLDWAAAVAIVVIAGIIAIRHEGNIRRLVSGNERRIGETIPT